MTLRDDDAAAMRETAKKLIVRESRESRERERERESRCCCSFARERAIGYAYVENT
jgi:hypothetical protein